MNNTSSSSLRILFGHSLIYALGSIVEKGIGFFMIPIYTRYLLPEDYGILELLITTFEVIGIFVNAGIISAISRHYYESAEEKERASVISTAIIIQLIFLFCASIGISTVTEDIGRLVFGKDGYSFYFKLMILNFLFSRFLDPPLIYLRIKERSVKYICLSLIKLVIALSLNIYTIVWLRLGVVGVIYSGIISSGLLLVYLYITTFREVGFNFSWSKAIAMLKYSAPLILSFLGSFIITFSDRYFLRVYSSLTELGIYSVGNKFASGLMLISGSFMLIWGVKRFELISSSDDKNIFCKTLRYYSFVLITAGVLLSVFSKPMIEMVTDPLYHNAYRVIPVLVLAYILGSWLNFVNLGILASKKTSYLSLANLIASIVCLGANYTLIPRFGGVGAAWATVIAYFILSATTYLFAQRLYRIDYNWADPLKILGIGIVITLLALFYKIDSLSLSLVFSALLFMSYTIITLIIVFNKGQMLKAIRYFNSFNLRNLISRP